jgi:hypothetical protein
VPSTWLQAIQAAIYNTWPGLTTDLVANYLPKSTATVKGHINQQRQNLRSTKPKIDEPTTTSRAHMVFAALVEATGQIATGLTGRFPTQSNQGHKYMFVLYDYDSNSILVEAMRNRSDPEFLRAYNKLHQRLLENSFRPTLQRLDNEASAALKRTMREKQIDYQLAPPHIHRRNAAERAIQTFKNHFIAMLCGTADPLFPKYLWDRLLPQAELTLNLLRQSRMHPKLSAYAHGNVHLISTAPHWRPEARGS